MPTPAESAVLQGQCFLTSLAHTVIRYISLIKTVARVQIYLPSLCKLVHNAWFHTSSIQLVKKFYHHPFYHSKRVIITQGYVYTFLHIHVHTHTLTHSSMMYESHQRLIRKSIL